VLPHVHNAEPKVNDATRGAARESACRPRTTFYNGADNRVSEEFAFMARPTRALFAIALLAGLSGCQFIKDDINKTLGRGPSDPQKQADLAASKVTTIGVNSYLWRAALDTLSFAPMAQVDSAGGVIVTDWYANPNSPGERVKVTATILDQDLRADALRVAASRQIMQNGQWIEAPVAAATVQKLEEIILTKARDLRRSAVAG
jgi:Domain of unknown function (DUF3576)